MTSIAIAHMVDTRSMDDGKDPDSDDLDRDRQAPNRTHMTNTNGPMATFKRVALLYMALVTTASLHAQSPSVYAVAMEYDPLPGYQYFFSRIDAGTGTVAHVAELPLPLIPT